MNWGLNNIKVPPNWEIKFLSFHKTSDRISWLKPFKGGFVSTQYFRAKWKSKTLLQHLQLSILKCIQLSSLRPASLIIQVFISRPTWIRGPPRLVDGGSESWVGFIHRLPPSSKSITGGNRKEAARQQNCRSGMVMNGLKEGPWGRKGYSRLL